MSEVDAAGPAAEGAPAPKPKSKLPWILLGCGCIGLPILICAGVFGLGAFGFAALMQAPADGARAHITQVADGDVAGAYDNCSDGFKASLTLEEFQAYVDANPLIYNSTDVSFSNVNISNNICNMSGTASGPDGAAPIGVVLFLRPGGSPTEAGSWQLHEPFN